MNEERTTSRKTRVGKVVSDKMDKTVVVIVEDRVAHKTYKKIIGRTYRLKAHDENNECAGDSETQSLALSCVAAAVEVGLDVVFLNCVEGCQRLLHYVLQYC